MDPLDLGLLLLAWWLRWESTLLVPAGNAPSVADLPGKRRPPAPPRDYEPEGRLSAVAGSVQR